MRDREGFLALYAQLGFATLPLVPRGKRPLRKGWRVPDPRAWDDVSPEANVGILTGNASGGLVVLDFDTEDGPFEVLGLRPRELAVRTVVVKTARGWHVYARGTGVGTSKPREGLDVRGEGAMVAAPPSVHPSGLAYEHVSQITRVMPLSELPPWSLPSRPEVARAPELVERADAWVTLQAPKLRAAWETLRQGAREDFDRSRADFALARCLWEAGWFAEEVAALLLALPGSKAAERGESYALRTAARAARLPSARVTAGGARRGSGGATASRGDARAPP